MVKIIQLTQHKFKCKSTIVKKKSAKIAQIPRRFVLYVRMVLSFKDEFVKTSAIQGMSTRLLYVKFVKHASKH